MTSAGSLKSAPSRSDADSLPSAFSGIANWFIPESMRLAPEARQRAMLFLVSHLLGPWLGLAVVGYLYALDSRPGPLLLTAIAIGDFWLFPFALRLTGRFVLLSLLSVQNLSF